jgi:hypothetical protein
MQQTLEQLKTLRLIGLLEAWQEQQGHPTYHDLTFDERFALLVEREYFGGSTNACNDASNRPSSPPLPPSKPLTFRSHGVSRKLSFWNGPRANG